MNEVIQLSTKRMTLEQELQLKGFTPDGIEWLLGRVQRYCDQAYRDGWTDCEAKADAIAEAEAEYAEVLKLEGPK